MNNLINALIILLMVSFLLALWILAGQVTAILDTNMNQTHKIIEKVKESKDRTVLIKALPGQEHLAKYVKNMCLAQGATKVKIKLR